MNIANFAQIKAKSIQTHISVARTPEFHLQFLRKSPVQKFESHWILSKTLPETPGTSPNPLRVHRVFGGWPCRPSWHLDRAYRPEALEHLSSERPGSPPSRCPGSHFFHYGHYGWWWFTMVDAEIISMVINLWLVVMVGGDELWLMVMNYGWWWWTMVDN